MIKLWWLQGGSSAPPPSGDPVALLPASAGLEGLPAGPQERAYAAACEILRTDPGLRSIGAAQRLVAFNGIDPRTKVPGAPGAPGLQGFAELVNDGTVPLIRIYPEDSPADWTQETAHNASFNLRIELAVAGERADGIMRLWYGVVRAFWPLNDDSPRANARIAALRDILQRQTDRLHGTLDDASWQVAQHATGIWTTDTAPPFTIGVGSIRANLMMETP